MMNVAWYAGFFTFVIVRTILGYTFDLSAVCHDGWHSTSIGSPGACSHHGGIDRSASRTALLVSLLSGVGMGALVIYGGQAVSPTNIQKRKTVREQKTKDIFAPDSVPQCPVHKERMILSRDHTRWQCRHACSRYFYVKDFPYERT
jgi:hypothetical protein